MSTRSSTSASACASSRAIAAAALLFACACAGELDDINRFAPPLPDAGTDGGTGDDGGTPDGGPTDGGCNALTLIIAPTCATAQCHSSGAEQGNLDLQSSGLPGRLINQAASGGPGFLIDPENPDRSVLYTKTLAPPPYGGQMPLLQKALNSTQEACLQSWIHASVGAP